MTTPEPNAPQERRVSLTITIRVDDIGQLDALKLDNAVRDLSDQYGADVISNQGAPRQINAPR